MSRKEPTLIDILRSVIFLDADLGGSQVKDSLGDLVDTDPPNVLKLKSTRLLLEENFHILMDRKISYGEDSGLFSIVIAFWEKYKYLPTYSILHNTLSQEGDRLTLNRLSTITPDLNKAALLIPNEFVKAVDQIYQKEKKETLLSIMSKSSLISEDGLDIKQGKTKVTLKGVDDTISFLLSELSELGNSSIRNKEGDIREEAQDIKEEYLHKEQSGAAFGILTEFKFLDSLTSGIQFGEMFTIAGFTGHCKTTFCLNAFYNSIFYYGNTGAYFSLEMPRKQVKRILSVIHSGNRKFRDVHPPVLYSNVKDGKLTESERDFYLNTVIPDLESNMEAGKMLVFQPDDAASVPLLRSKLETYHKEDGQNSVDFVVVDHPGLMVPRRRTGNPYEDMNQILRDLKQLALTFAKNRGIAVWVPYQINRSGWREAMENEGVYKIDCLAQASEAERSSDIVIALYLDNDLRNDHELLVTFLKSRDADLPTKPIKLGTILKSRCIVDYIETVYSQDFLLEIIPT